MKPTVQHFFHKDSSTCTFVCYDPATKDGIVIDPVTDLDMVNWQTSTDFNEVVAKWVDDNGIKLHAVLDTHTHADHITGGAYFKERYNIPYCIGDKITIVQKTFSDLYNLQGFKCDGSQFDRLLKDQEVLTYGSLTIKCLASHGHTPNCLSYLAGNCLFTGDVMFIEDFGCGRCDFPGGSAADLYDSVMRLFALPGDTRVFVGHDYQPGGRDLRVETTMEAEREKNDDMTIRANRDEFIAGKTKWDSGLSFPKMIFPSLLVNINAGRLPEPAANGQRYFVIPMNLKAQTDSIGTKVKK